jgi:hypothetical protein
LETEIAIYLGAGRDLLAMLKEEGCAIESMLREN